MNLRGSSLAVGMATGVVGGRRREDVNTVHIYEIKNKIVWKEIEDKIFSQFFKFINSSIFILFFFFWGGDFYFPSFLCGPKVTQPYYNLLCKSPGKFLFFLIKTSNTKTLVYHKGPCTSVRPKTWSSRVSHLTLVVKLWMYTRVLWNRNNYIHFTGKIKWLVRHFWNSIMMLLPPCRMEQ